MGKKGHRGANATAGPRKGRTVAAGADEARIRRDTAWAWGLAIAAAATVGAAAAAETGSAAWGIAWGGLGGLCGMVAGGFLWPHIRPLGPGGGVFGATGG